MFDKEWFLKHQRLLLFFANTFVGRRILCIWGERSSVGKNKIIKILPNAIFWKTGKKHYFEVRTSNKFANRIYYAFYPLWKLIHSWDMVWFPNFNLGFDIFHGQPLYPLAGDGHVENTGATYATVQSATNGDSYDYVGTATLARNEKVSSTYYVTRAFFPFDFTIFSAGDTILTGTFSLFGNSKDNTLDDTIRTVLMTQASTTALALSDFSKVGATGGGDFGAISALSTVAYNDCVLNATAIGWMNTAVASSLKLGIRTTGDIGASSPGARSYMFFWTSAQTGTANDPKLTGTYTPVVTVNYLSKYRRYSLRPSFPGI